MMFLSEKNYNKIMNVLYGGGIMVLLSTYINVKMLLKITLMVLARSLMAISKQ